MSFFSDIQGKFKEGYEGRYFGHIFEVTSRYDDRVAVPFVKLLEKRVLLDKISIKGLTYCFDSEYVYKEKALNDSARRSDLILNIYQNGVLQQSVLIEIKVNDSLTNGQLRDYIDWCKKNSAKRKLIVLTAHSLSSIDQKIIDEAKDVATNLYFTDYATELASFSKASDKSPYIEMLLDYFKEEGYMMYDLLENKDSKFSDLEAFKSFLVLNFLPHASGWGKVAARNKVSNGPTVFSKLIHNWQLVSAYIKNENYPDQTSPSIRYYPQQQFTNAQNISNFSDNLAIDAIKYRKNKQAGRYYFDSQINIDNQTILVFGQVIQISKGQKEIENKLKCGLYAMFFERGLRSKGIGKSKEVWLRDGLEDPQLYNVGKFAEIIKKLIAQAETSIEKEVEDFPEIGEEYGNLPIFNKSAK